MFISFLQYQLQRLFWKRSGSAISQQGMLTRLTLVDWKLTFTMKCISCASDNLILFGWSLISSLTNCHLDLWNCLFDISSTAFDETFYTCKTEYLLNNKIMCLISKLYKRNKKQPIASNIYASQGKIKGYFHNTFSKSTMFNLDDETMLIRIILTFEMSCCFSFLFCCCSSLALWCKRWNHVMKNFFDYH